MDVGATIDDLNYHVVADTTDLGATIAALVGHFVTKPTIAGRTTWRPVTRLGFLAVAQAHVDFAGAYTAGDIGGYVACGGSISAGAS